LNLVEFRERKYDPVKVVYDFTMAIKAKAFVHEDDRFDDLFLVAEQFSQVQSLASLRLNPNELAEFHKYGHQRFMHVPLNLLKIIAQES